MIDEIIQNACVDLTMILRFLITQTKAPPTIIEAYRSAIRANRNFPGEWYDRRYGKLSVVQACRRQNIIIFIWVITDQGIGSSICKETLIVFQ